MGTSSLSLKRVFDQLRFQAAVRCDRDSDHGVADRAAPFRECAVLRGRRLQSASLAGTDPLEWRAERVRGARLHLDHDEVAPAPADEIELAAPGEEASAH